MPPISRVCVFCGSSPGTRPEHGEAARALGRTLVDRGLTLVYGGATVGLMGEVARAVLEAGGEAIGVLPKVFVARERTLPRLTELHIVDDLAARKTTMASIADSFVALPGGFGTLDELFEMAVGAQFRWHAKPIGLLNVRGYYDGLLTWVGRAVQEGFVPADHERILQVAEEPAALLDRLVEWQGVARSRAAGPAEERG